MNKRGQITIFIVVGILIILTVGFFIFRGETQKEELLVNYDLIKVPYSSSVENYVQSCLNEVSEKGLLRTGHQGGYYNPPVDYSIVFFDDLLPYYYFDDTSMVIEKDKAEEELKKYVEEKMVECVNDFVLHKEQGYNIYAENPVKGFLPSTGLLKRLRFPDAGPHVRIDTGVEEGDEVTPYYDPMIAKLIVWDEDRNRALRRLRTALQNTQVVGVKTNTAFLSRIAVNSDFADANLDTGFIERHIAELVPEPGATPVRALAISALAILLERANEAAFSALGNGDPTSPWHQVDGWRMNDDGHDEIKLVDDEEVITIPVRYMPDGYQMTIDDQILKVNGELEAGDHIVANIDGVRIVATVLHDAAGVTVIDAGHVYQIGVYDVLAAAEVDDTSTGGVVAPLPGKVVAVLTEAGISVDKGTPLMIVEAMKMEHTITAPADGLVDEVLFAVGDSVDEGSVLVDFKISEA